jgi:hypothetical protein
MKTKDISEPIAYRTRSRINKLKNKRENLGWVSATKTHNYMLNDGMCDWLKLYGKKRKINYNKQVKHYENTFTDFLMNKGLEFEKQVIKYLKKEFKCIKVADFYTLGDTKKTLKFMKQGIPIIYSAPVYNPDNKTYGIIDLLVRSDYINKIFNSEILSKTEESIYSPLLDTKYHYRVIDIKFSTLNLASDGKHLLNSGRNPAYKSQLYIYNRAISNLQGYDPNCGYIMGRRWKYNSKGKYYSGDSCIDTLGIIDFNNYDSDYIIKTSQAISWYRDVMENGINWTIYPPSKPELYPNMCIDSNNFNEMKNKVANNIGEITMLWNCGIKNRVLAMKQGIDSWRDERCCSKLLGFNENSKNGKIIDNIISVNRNEDQYILPVKLENNKKKWLKKNKYEMFVDFETFNDVCMNITDIPKQMSYNMIFMIGIGMRDRQNNWIYKSFIAKKSSKDEELRIMNEFINYYNNYNSPPVYYWCAEKNFWNSASNYHNINNNNINWIDMCDIFKSEQIVIKNCFGFGLKQITKNMRELGMIDTQLQSECCNGMMAMLKAWKSYNLKNPDTTPIMKDVEKYNEFDCKALFDIINFLRQKYN